MRMKSRFQRKPVRVVESDTMALEVVVGAGDSVRVPLQNNGAYDLLVDFGAGDGDIAVNAWDDANATYTYSTAGTYVITLKGTAYGIDTWTTPENAAFRPFLSRVLNMGDLNSTGGRINFYACTNLTEIHGKIKRNPLINWFAKSCTSLTYIDPELMHDYVGNTPCSSMFSSCTSLTEIPDYLYANLPNIGDLGGIFNGCTSLTTIPEHLLYNNGTTGVGNMFNGCTNITTIPENLFRYATNITNFYSTFASSGITSIPAKLFYYNVNAASFFNTFYNCSSLSGTISPTLFANNTSVTTFESTFSGCSSLSGTISPTFFSNNTLASRFYRTFYNCSGLGGDIPGTFFPTKSIISTTRGMFQNTNISSVGSELLKDATSLSIARDMFYGCDNLLTVGSSIFENCINLSDALQIFNNCDSLTTVGNRLFYNCSSITTVQGLFDNCVSLSGTVSNTTFYNCSSISSFLYAFKNTNISAIEAGTLDTCTDATSFSYAFSSCDNLTTLPTDLFRYNVNVTTFDNVFYNSGLTSLPENLFYYNTSVTNYQQALKLLSSLVSLPSVIFDLNNISTITSIDNFMQSVSITTGTIQDIWNYIVTEQDISYANAFTDCTNFDNYADIPNDWKGL